jgi:hypothetical protein
VAIRIVERGKAVCGKHAERYFPCWSVARREGDFMERENSSMEQVKDQEGRVMHHLRKSGNGRRKRRRARANGAVSTDGRRSWQQDEALREMVDRAWSHLPLKEQVSVLLQRLAN